MTPEQTISDIQAVITSMISAGLSDEQRYPALQHKSGHEAEIRIQGAPELSASLRDVPYDQIYSELLAAGAFNLRLIDGALIQMLYTFSGTELASHRLAFFPSPILENYEDAQTVYDRDEEFGEFVARYLVKFPIRFDFSIRDHIDIEHPKCHLTLGQYRNCRIPVVSPITPSRFIQFIVRNFYSPALNRLRMTRRSLEASFPNTITANERQISHFVI